MIKNAAAILLLSLFFANISAQNTSNINKINWDNDYKLYLTLSNDSNLAINVDTLFHADIDSSSGENGFTYYPVNFSKDFIMGLEGREVDLSNNEANNTDKQTTLWSALNSTLGGGWVHFINSLLYSLETKQLSLTAPLMKRPDSDWKPKPMTDSYKRTKNWEYYVPVTQKNAIKEYKLQKENGSLENLNGVPEDFIELFLSMSDKQYQIMKEHNMNKQLSRIDLVKLLLGSSYLSMVQIDYIKSMVTQAVQLNATKLPSVIILDDYAAAVVMSLNEYGYHIENIDFRDADDISEEEINLRKKKIYSIINQINLVNQELLEQKLKKYFN